MTPASPFLQREELPGGILRLTMTQPGRKNAMNAAMRAALFAAVQAAQPDPGTRALVLTGAAGTFSAGGDIKGLMQIETSAFRAYLQEGHALVRALWGFEKPAVAAIEGVGVGGGLALAMCCDRIILGDGARIGFTFIRIGFVPDWGTPFTVPRRIGRAAAARLFLGGEIIGAGEALRLGLVDEVVPDARVQEAAVAAAERLAGNPARAFALTKRMMRNLPDNLDAALEMELLAQQGCFKSEEFLQGAAPFL